MAYSGREAYKDELAKIADNNKKLIAIEADLGGKEHPFEKKHPSRFFNFGIAEMASIDIATGLSEAGYIPFFSTFSAFAALRCAESVKLSLGYMNKNVKIVGSYGGVSGGWFGTTHHCLEDVAIINSFPDIRIACPHGEAETRRIVREAANSTEPYYIRLSRNESFESIAFEAVDKEYVPDFPFIDNAEICLISIGELGTEFCRNLKKENDINHVHLVYVDKKSIMTQLSGIEKMGKKFIVVEEHRLAGSIASLLSLLLPKYEVYSFSVSDDWPLYGGSQTDVLEHLKFSRSRLENMIEVLK